MPKKSGFTLVELLVVISIIALLSVVGAIVYSTVLKQGRDSKRQSDLNAIQSALEQYYSDHLYYPPYVNGTDMLCEQSTLNGYYIDTPIGCSLKDTTGNKTYINKIPKDPLYSSQIYCYRPQPTDCGTGSNPQCSRYNLYAVLENPPAGASTFTCRSVSTYNIELTSPP